MTPVQPAGDPEAMRATARALIARADGVRLAPESAVAGFEALVLEGPAAARLQMAAREVRDGVQQAAAGLEAVAADLYADAVIVEQRNEERRLAAVAAAHAADAEAAADAQRAGAEEQKPQPSASVPEPAPPATAPAAPPP